MNRIEENRETNKKHIDDILSRPIEQQGNMGLIREEIKKFGGKFCNFHGVHYGYVIGAVADSHDYYWCYLDEKGEIRFSTCCSNPILEDSENKHEFIPLLYAVRMYPDVFFGKVKKHMWFFEDVFFTDVYIGDKIFGRHAMNH